MLSCFILFYFSLNSSPILSCSLSFYTGRSFYDLSLLCAEGGIRYSDSNSDLLTFGIVGTKPPPSPPPPGKKSLYSCQSCDFVRFSAKISTPAHTTLFPGSFWSGRERPGLFLSHSRETLGTRL